MALLEEVRRELTRQGVSQVGRALIEDPVRGRGRKAREQHLRNAAGSLVVVASQLAWRRSGTLTLWIVTRKAVRAQLGYGLAELRQAASGSPNGRRRVTPAYAAIAGATAALAAGVGGMLARARRKAGTDAGDQSS